MSLKMLYILNIADRVNNFSYASMVAATELGIEYHIAGNWNYSSDNERKEDEKKYGIFIHQIDFIRTPYHPGNLIAFKQLKKILEKEKFDIIHCNTPIGGVAGRILGNKFKVKNIIYQAHGFHFYAGAPKINWLIYYPIERLLAHKTDVIITINNEDLERAKRFKLRNNGQVYYVPGVGIDLTKYDVSGDVRNKKREELKLKDDDVALISVGELNQNKNNKVIIEALAALNCENIKYFICGVGNTENELRDLSKSKNIENNVKFLGYRDDIKDLLRASDIFVMPSLREGLSRSIMEAMASGLPCIVSKIRGNIDLIDANGGFLCNPLSSEVFSDAIFELKNNVNLREKMGKYNENKIKYFDLKYVIRILRGIYSEIVKNNI